MGLWIISTITIWIFSWFMFIIIFLANYYAELDLNVWIFIWLIVFINLVLWLISPFFSNLIYKWFYKINWINLEELEKTSPKTVEIIKKICNENNIKIPKLGLIPDENPTAFTYWSWKWNARIVISNWIISFLSDDERSAVFAHELGHIKNNDFIIMTIASTLLQILYELYFVFTNSKSNSNNDGKSKLVIIWIISYIFYFIWQYVLLYLSRIREYYADEVSWEYTDPNLLAEALIKIAYWILVTPTNNRLIESTKFIWIANDKMAKWIWVLYYNAWKNDTNELIQKSFLYDIKNPWAKIWEFFSTHPLTWNRINRLMTLTNTPKYDIKAINEKFPVDNKKLYTWFGKDLAIISSIYLLPIILVILSIIIWLNNAFWYILIIPSILIWFWFSLIINTLWAYSNENKVKTNVLELMSDVYASPVKWKNIELNWIIIWKWEPWYVFSEDFMLKDETWLMTLDFQSKIPIIWNLIFSLTKVNEFIWKQVISSWWFFRWVWNYTVIDKMKTLDWNQEIKWGMKFWWLAWWIISIIIWIIILFVN